MYLNRGTVSEEVTLMVRIPSTADILCSFTFLHSINFSQSPYTYNDSSYVIVIFSPFLHPLLSFFIPVVISDTMADTSTTLSGFGTCLTDIFSICSCDQLGWFHFLLHWEDSRFSSLLPNQQSHPIFSASFAYKYLPVSSSLMHTDKFLLALGHFLSFLTTIT